MPVTSPIHEFLREAHAAYTVLTNRPAVTAQNEAATRLPGRDWAKVVVCFVADEPVQAVLPATQGVNLERLSALAGGGEIRLAQEDELRRLYPGCEPGAMPALGPLYAQEVFVDVSLATESEIIFKAGTHTEAIRMRWADFAASVRPIVGKFAAPLLDHVGEYRLSYRE